MPPAAVAWVFALGVAGLAGFSPGILNDGDSFSHIASGNWMLAHRAVIHTDPFSYSFAGQPWVSHEWLSEILLAASYRAAGWAGVMALAAGAVALAFLNLGRHLGRFLPAGPVALLLALALTCTAGTLLARPHILALPVFEAWAAGLISARAAGRAPSWWLVALMCLWANLHGGFVIGLALAGAMAAEAVMESPAKGRTAVRWGAFLAASMLAAAATPHGLAGLLLPFQLTGLTQLAGINEWAPPNFAVLQPVEIVLAAGLFVSLSRGARLPPLRILILLGLMHMALHHARHVQLVAVIGPLLIAGPAGAALGAGPRAGWPWPASGAVLAGLLLAARLALPVARGDGPVSPVSALAHVPPALRAAPVLNEYAFGGYLIFAGVRPFIDGRAEMYGDAFLAQYAALSGGDADVLHAVLSRYGIEWAILVPGSPAARQLAATPGWCAGFTDAYAVILTRCQAG